MTKIKICGLKSLEDIEIVNDFLPDYIGFILAPSKRQIDFEKARLLRKHLNSKIQAVGVFVNESKQEILKYCNQGIIDRIQLHGDEQPDYIRELKEKTKLPIIKAILVKNEEELMKKIALYTEAKVDFFLLDTYVKGSQGGTGQRFDWQLLKKIKAPYFLAGGINPDNIKEAIQEKPYAIDISSGVETEGTKDREKIRQVIEAVRGNQGIILN